jgi:hypothetical protein
VEHPDLRPGYGAGDAPDHQARARQYVRIRRRCAGSRRYPERNFFMLMSIRPAGSSYPMARQSAGQRLQPRQQTKFSCTSCPSSLPAADHSPTPALMEASG